MTSDANYTQAFVWVWLPDQTEPIVAGLLSASGKQLVFNYGRSYLARKDAIPLYEPELPLRSGILLHTAGLGMPSCIRDAAPDAWGRRIIINRKFGAQGKNVDPGRRRWLFSLSAGIRFRPDRRIGFSGILREFRGARRSRGPSPQTPERRGAGRKGSSSAGRTRPGPSPWKAMGGARPRR